MVGAGPKLQGVCFVANDAVFDVAVAFLNSFRIYNPNLPLCLIPFAADYERLAQLQEEYEFTILPDDALLARCDALSNRFHGKTFGHYRKVASWHSPFDEFLYIDIEYSSPATARLRFRISAGL